jgi:DMSO reductase family type II enzyme chaperone
MSGSAKSPSCQNEVECAQARETIYRLAAVALGYPLEETLTALQEGRLQAVFSDAWQTLGDEPWPELEISASLHALEVGYMGTFIHGKRGKPRVSLVASAHSDLIGGLTPGAFLLNVQAFYSHFGLKAAIEDEGHQDEPDHLVAMLEFCALLCYLERQALEQDKDSAPYRRAQRDFLMRYLIPLLQTIRSAYEKESKLGLDPNLEHLLKVLPGWASSQQLSLEKFVGAYSKEATIIASSESANQSMWD